MRTELQLITPTRIIRSFASYRNANNWSPLFHPTKNGIIGRKDARLVFPQLLRCESNRFNAGFGFDRDDRGSPCKQIDIAGEITGTAASEHHTFAGRDIDGSHRARKNYEAVERIVPGGDEWIIFSNGASFPKWHNLREFAGIKARIGHGVRERVETKAKKIPRPISPWEL